MNHIEALGEFTLRCERTAEQHPGCVCCTGTLPRRTYIRTPKERRGYQVEAIVPVRGHWCGVLVCRGCGYLLTVGVGDCRRATAPSEDVLREIEDGPLGKHIKAVQRSIRLERDRPTEAVVELGKAGRCN